MAIENDMKDDEATAGDQPSCSAGVLLRAERERIGLSEKDAADALHITMHYLRSVEADRYDKLPGAVFAKGYVRSYAQFLKLDVDQILALYEGSLSPAPEVARERTRNTFIQRIPDKKPSGSLPWTVVSVIAFVVGFVSVWAYSRYFASADELSVYSTVNQTSRLVSDAEPQIAVRPQPGLQPMLAGAAVGVPGDTVNEAVTGTALSGAAVEASIADPEPANEIVNQQLPEAGAIDVAAAPESIDPVVDTVVAAPAEPAVEDSAQRVIAVSNPGSDVLEIRFSGDCWIEVSDDGAAPVYRDIRGAGDILQITGDAPFSVLLGDAVFATVEFNGEVLDMSSQIRIDNTARLTVGP